MMRTVWKIFSVVNCSIHRAYRKYIKGSAGFLLLSSTNENIISFSSLCYPLVDVIFLRFCSLLFQHRAGQPAAGHRLWPGNGENFLPPLLQWYQAPEHGGSVFVHEIMSLFLRASSMWKLHLLSNVTTTIIDHYWILGALHSCYDL